MERIGVILAVAAGGAAGALARWGITLGVQRIGGPAAFPLGTLAANLLGCFALGLCHIWLVERLAPPPLRLGLMVGLLGALTTFSTYSLESVLLLQQRRYTAAMLYLITSVMLGLAAVAAGMALARRF